MFRARLLSLLCLAITPLAPPAAAQVRLEGFFIASDSCEAFQSKNNLTNPGDIVTEPERAYEMLGINKAGGDFFQVRVDEAPVVTARWVHVSCGIHAIEADTATSGGGGPQPMPEPVPGAEATDNLLALSWQPAFCETRPSKTECEQLNDGLLPITETQLSIHGLWPQPRENVFCGVSSAMEGNSEGGRWHLLPEPDLDAETFEDLSVAMPGVASGLHRHEWIKHGTCYKGEGGADEYYDDTLFLTEAINRDVVFPHLDGRVGGFVSGDEIRAAFDAAYGDGAGARVQLICTGDQGRTLIVELRIALEGEISPTADLSDLIRAADTQPAGCDGGLIDPTGLQP